jgi:hypothetical protein
MILSKPQNVTTYSLFECPEPIDRPKCSLLVSMIHTRATTSLKLE